MNCLMRHLKISYKETRKGWKIEVYYGKPRSGRQGKTFLEIILRIGNKNDIGEETADRQIGVRILDKYMKDF